MVQQYVNCIYISMDVQILYSPLPLVMIILLSMDSMNMQSQIILLLFFRKLDLILYIIKTIVGISMAILQFLIQIKNNI
jgi:hypothetical protein